MAKVPDEHAPIPTPAPAEDGHAEARAAEGGGEAPLVAVLGRADRVVMRAAATEEGEEEMTSTTTQPAAEREHRPYDIEILAPGTFSGVTVTEADLQHIADHFQKLKGLHDVPVAVRLGHNDEQVLAQDDSNPAFGWAERVYKKGSGATARLMATIVGMPRALREAINAQAYRKVSASLYPAWQSTEAERNLRTGIKGKVLQHIAFLGTSIPRIRQLADLPRVLAADERDDEEAVILCLSDPPTEGLRAAAEPDADDEPTKHAEPPLTLGERVRRAERNLKLLERGRKACEVVMGTYDTPRRFTSFDAAASPDRAGSLSQLYLAELDAAIERAGLDRDDPAVRAKVGRELLLEWASRAPSASAPPAESLAAQIDSRDVQRAIMGAAPSKTQPTRFSAYDATGTATSAGSTRSNGYAREKGVMKNNEKHDTPPLYGTAAIRAAELGSEANYRRLLVIASEHELRLSRTDDARRAEAMLFAEAGESDAMRFAEARGGNEAPPRYGSRGRPTPTPSARDLAFSENVAARLRTMDMLDPHRIAKAYRAEAAMHPQLTPDYGWSTRARRARG